MKTKKNIMEKFHCAIAAEAYAAARFARYGYDVSVQYGANQPEYDLVIAKGHNMLKVNVKGTQQSAWFFVANKKGKQRKTRHGMIKDWFRKHKSNTIYCLVQFRDTEQNQ